MILLLGASGYLGHAFADALRRRGQPFIPLTRSAIDYTQLDILFGYVRKIQPSLLINAAGFVGKPNVEACEIARDKAIFWNTLLPQTISRACLMTNTPWAHLSSACVYSGARVHTEDEVRLERNLDQPEVLRLWQQKPGAFRGFSEADAPNFCFRAAPCSFYSGTKALAEEAIHGVGQNYIWRLGMTFDERDGARNLLSRIMGYPKVYDCINSLSHLDDAVQACLDLWELRAPFGIYHLTNSGAISNRQIVSSIEHILKPNRTFEFWQNAEEFQRATGQVPRSPAILDGSKLAATGIRLRPVQKAIESALQHWRSGPATAPLRPPDNPA